VAGEAAERNAVVGGGVVLACLDGVGEVPDQQRLVAGGGDDEGRVVDGRRNRRHLFVVAAHQAGEHQGLLTGHGGWGVRVSGARGDWRRRRGRDGKTSEKEGYSLYT
jgi:hypothetical protein